MMSLMESHRPSSKYAVVLTFTFVVVFISHTNNIMGRTATLL